MLDLFKKYIPRNVASKLKMKLPNTETVKVPALYLFLQNRLIFKFPFFICVYRPVGLLCSHSGV